MSNSKEFPKGKWYIVKFENDRLTTCRDGGRYEDFEISEEDHTVFANKHFGDHEYESGTIVDIHLDRELPVLNVLIKAAVHFHAEGDYLWIS